MTACFVATDCGTDFLGELVSVESTCLSTGTGQHHSKEVEFIHDSHVVERAVTLLPVGPTAKRHDGAFLGGWVTVQFGACCLFK